MIEEIINDAIATKNFLPALLCTILASIFAIWLLSIWKVPKFDNEDRKQESH